MMVVKIVTRTGRFLSIILRNSRTRVPPTRRGPVVRMTIMGVGSPKSGNPRSSTSVVTPNTTAPKSPPQRRARIVRTPRGGKDSPSFLPSASPLLSPVSVVAWSASVALRSAPASASSMSGAVEASSLESAAPGWVLGSVPG